MRTCFLIVTFAFQHAVLAHGEIAATNQTAELPLVIPYPQTIRKVDDEHLILGEGGKSTFEIVGSEKGDFLDEASSLIETELRERGLKPEAKRPSCSIILATRSSRQKLPLLSLQVEHYAIWGHFP